MENELKILYVDMGGVTLYCYDKVAGRILGWADKQNDVFLLASKLIEQTAKKEICDISKHPERIKIITLPFSDKKRPSSPGIIISYFLRILISPLILFKKAPVFDFAFSNSPVLVDVIPILWLKFFGKCRHWILMMDSVVPKPNQREGSRLVNTLTYLESRLVLLVANYFATMVFTVNPELKKEMVKRGVNPKKIYLSKNGLFNKKIAEVSKRGGRNYDAVYMGRITENKGIFDLLLVWAKIVEKIPLAKLAIMGTGRSEAVERFMDCIKKNKLEKNIDYLGFADGDKKYEILKSSKIFIFLSKVNADESWGISLMEALACGLPAITYNLAIYKHVYNDGILQKCEIGDVNSVIDRALRFLSNEKERDNLSERCMSFAMQFDWFKIAQEDLDKIRKIIKA